MKRALVCGAGGFIGGHLVKKLKREGYWVRGADIKEHEFAPTAADEFLLLDLREPENCKAALSLGDGHPSTSPSLRLGSVQATGPSTSSGHRSGRRSGQAFDEVYQLAADMGGMGYIHSAECDIMHNSALINIHMIDTAAKMGVPRYFFSSSVCVYRDMQPGEPELTEDEAVPANPDNEYGWEKLYAERMALAYSRHYPIAVRIARFQNCYGPEGTWNGGREKAPAAICRKVAEVKDGGTIEVWGDGTAIRSYTYIGDMVDGIYMLMQSDPSTALRRGSGQGSGHSLEGPVNIGCPQYVTVDELVATVAEVAGKTIDVKHIEGPVGVHSRNFSNARIYSLGWRAKVFLKDGIALMYPWIETQVRAVREAERSATTRASR